MRHRSVASFGLLMAAAAIVAVATRPLSGQAPASPAKLALAKKWTAPRTPDGQPDRQGFWTNSSYVPHERRENVQNANYTEQEFQEVVKAAALRESEQTEPGTVA